MLLTFDQAVKERPLLTTFISICLIVMLSYPGPRHTGRYLAIEFKYNNGRVFDQSA